jgi:hypothetical protein
VRIIEPQVHEDWPARDLATDVHEVKNLAAEKPDLAKELTQLVMGWRETWPKRK